MARLHPITIRIEHVYTISDEARELLALLRAAAEAEPKGKHAVPVKVIKTDRPLTQDEAARLRAEAKQTAADIEHRASDVERLATVTPANPDAWVEPVCIFCGATSATSNMFLSAADGVWRCQAHSD